MEVPLYILSMWEACLVYRGSSYSLCIYRYEGIFVLQTFDAEGKINHYVLGVDSEVYPHFFGPGMHYSMDIFHYGKCTHFAGPLVIVDRYAYFQLFIIDPRVSTFSGVR